MSSGESTARRVLFREFSKRPRGARKPAPHSTPRDREAMSVGALRLGLARVLRPLPRVPRPRRAFTVATRASSEDPSPTMANAPTVASTRAANYALGSRVLADSTAGAGKNAPAQLVLHADWVTCTQ
jgi:hypothetical protein